MLTLLSPAKTLDSEPLPASVPYTDLLFAEKAAYLAGKLAKFSPKKLRTMMDISEELAQLNVERFQQWSLPITPGKGKQAIFAFHGDVYLGLEASLFSQEHLSFAQNHLRILSGLYGVLRPLDLMLPYRLEMGTTWNVTPKKKSLYAFWKETLTQHIAKEVRASESNLILNLASQEYAKVIDFKKLNVPVIAPEFKEERGGRYQMISFFAKKARGMMAAFAIKHEVKAFQELKNFDSEGYSFNERLSEVDNNKWVFTRKSK